MADKLYAVADNCHPAGEPLSDKGFRCGRQVVRCGRQVVTQQRIPCWTRALVRQGKGLLRTTCRTMMELCSKSTCFSQKLTRALPGRHSQFWPSAAADPACEPISAREISPEIVPLLACERSGFWRRQDRFWRWYRAQQKRHLFVNHALHSASSWHTAVLLTTRHRRHRRGGRP